MCLGLSRCVLDQGFESIDPEGFIDVNFSGITDAPLKKIECRKPSLAVTRGGIIVLSSVIAKGSVAEIGHGGWRVSRVDEPDLGDSHNAINRLNIPLGRQTSKFDEHSLGFALRAQEEPLLLSQVVSINDQEIPHYYRNPSIDEMWKR